MSRPKLLERFVGYVRDIDDESFFLANEDEQIEVPIRNLPRIERERLSLGNIGTLLVYENRIRFRFSRLRWTDRQLARLKRKMRNIVKKIIQIS